MGSRLDAARPRPGCHTFGRKSRRVRESVRCRDRHSAIGVAAVADLTDLSAGGLRSSATVGAAHQPKGAGARRVGTDPPNGLATAEWQHARTNPRWPSASVLGPEACRVRGIEESRNPNSSPAEAGLLRSKRVLLGRSDFVSSRDALERCSIFFVLEWSCGEGYSVARRQINRIAVSTVGRNECLEMATTAEHLLNNRLQMRASSANGAVVTLTKQTKIGLYEQVRVN